MTTAPPEIPSEPRPKWVPVGLDSVIGVAPLLSEAGDHSAAAETGRTEDPNIGRIFGKYRVIRQIGRGGMAVVYLAHAQDSPDQDVAIKVLSQESALSQATITRFLKEGQAISAIRHPNVIQLVEPPGRTADGQVYLVMELLTGKPLSEIITEMTVAGQAFTWPRLAPLILQICRALHATHKRKIVHRDMKPSNCFCTELDDDPWHVKVLDFGIAKVQSTGLSDDSIETPLTQDGVFVGTPHYAAPEIIERRPEHTIDGRADIFSLGVMMYQCLTGTLPFEKFRKDTLTALYKTAHERPESPRSRAPAREIPPEVEALVMRAMELEVNERFASVLDLAAAIRSTIRPSQTGGHSSVAELTPPSTSSSGAESTPLSASGSSIGITPPASAALSESAARIRTPQEQGTPPPPGVTALDKPTEGPTSIQRVKQPSAASPIVIAGLMVAGLLAILALILLETLGGSHARPAQSNEPRPSGRAL
jgi:serine/threonine protein kinase